MVHGDCRGADKLCDLAAENLAIPRDPNPAPWEMMGFGAGPKRNRYMLHKHPEADAVLAFHNDIKHSRGTKDMIQAAICEAGLPVYLYSLQGIEFF